MKSGCMENCVRQFESCLYYFRDCKSREIQIIHSNSSVVDAGMMASLITGYHIYGISGNIWRRIFIGSILMRT